MNARATTELLRNQAKYNKAKLDYINNKMTEDRQEREKELARSKKAKEALTNTTKDISGDNLGGVFTEYLGW